jgi:hypothetical protein
MFFPGFTALDDLNRFCCLNPDCPDYGRRGTGKLSVCMRYGRARQHRARGVVQAVPRRERPQSTAQEELVLLGPPHQVG